MPWYILNLHMLFNSLNTLRSLVREAPGRAQDYIQELSRVLYEDNLVFDIAVDAGSEMRRLPPMSVQLLIENAVKHNEISNRHPLTIRIKAEGDRLEVSNLLQPKLTVSAGMGIGLVNLAKRYKLLFKEDIGIKEENHIFSVIIPLI